MLEIDSDETYESIFIILLQEVCKTTRTFIMTAVPQNDVKASALTKLLCAVFLHHVALKFEIILKKIEYI